MALIKADRVKESSTSTGASTFALAGAYTGFRSFSSVCSVGDTFYYVIDSDLGSEWETGLGTYSAVNTLTRTTVHSSSNSNSIVTFSAGTKNVYISLTGNQLGTLSTLAGSETLTNKTINASNNTITNVSLTSGVTGNLPLGNGGTGTTTAQLAINALAGAVTSGSYLRGNGTNVVMATISAGDVPTLNQNTTGTASGSVSGTASYLAKFTSTNVVGNSLIYDTGTDIGLGTTSPATYGAGLVVYRSVNASVGLTVINPSATSAASSFVLVGSAATGGTYGFIQYNSSSYVGTGFYDSPNTTILAAGTNSNLHIGTTGASSKFKFFANSTSTVRMQIGTDGFVGINETSPGAQLQVTTAAAATKGLIVRGASAQSASLLEAQASAGTSLFKVYPNASGDTFIECNTGTASRNLGFYLYNQTTASGSACGIAYQSVAGFTGYSGIGAYLTASDTLYVHTVTASDIVFVPSNAERMRITSAGNVGIGTASPSDKLHVVGNVRAGNYTYGYLAMTGDLPGYANGVYPTLKSDQTIYFSADGKYSAYLGDASKNVFGLLHPTAGTSNVLLNPNGTSYFTGGSVALGATTAPAGQLYVTPQAAATKGLVVRGASAQSANLQEWQNNAGTALAYVSSDASVIGTPSNCYIGANDNSGGQIILYGYAGGYGMGFKTTSLGGEVIRFNSGQVTLTVGQGGNNAGLLVNGNLGSSGSVASFVNAGNVASKGIVVKGAASQTANLQEWQNNAGTVLAQIDSAGNANLRSFGIYDYSRSSGNTADYRHNCLFRNIPDTVGDYVEIGELTTSTLWEVEVLAWRAGYDATYGTQYNLIRKKYYLTTRYLSQGIVIPDFVSNQYSTFNDFELELVNDGIGIATRLRLRRTIAVAGALTSFQAMIKIIGAATYPTVASVSEMSGTGTSALSLAYRSVGYNTARYSCIYPPPPAGGSGSGMPLYVSGGDAVGTGDGGSVILQSGAFSTSGSNGKVIVRGLASNTVNLQEWQNSAGSVLSAVRSNGAIQPASMADSAATNNSIYYSTTASKLVYKDAAGTVNNLY